MSKKTGFLLVGACCIAFAAAVSVYFMNIPEPRKITTTRQPFTPHDATTPATGLLRILPANTRYLTTDGVTGIVLTGSHTWSNFMDSGYGDPPPEFDYERYLQFLSGHNHNFFRLWTWEQARHAPWVSDGNYFFSPMPYLRTGPGLALDGKQKFNLDRPNEEYFRRLRDRVKKAGDYGIFVAVMLFDGWSIDNKHGFLGLGNGWSGHPFNGANNVNGIDADLDHDGDGEEYHQLLDPRVTDYQEKYVTRVLDVLGDLDNVLYEISNESYANSEFWQYHMIDFIKRHEAGKAKQHLVGMTTYVGLGKPTNDDLYNSNADWISPNNGVDNEFADDPPPATGKKVVVLDTDHIWGIGGSSEWAWKAFLRGYHVLFMDGYDGAAVGLGAPPQWDIRHAGWKLAIKKLIGLYEPEPGWDPNAEQWVQLRATLGDIQGFAQIVPLETMEPRNDLTSTDYCLAGGYGSEMHYLIFAVAGEPVVTVDLVKCTGTAKVEVFDTEKGVIRDSWEISGGAYRNLATAPGHDSVFHVRAENCHGQ